MPRDRLVLILCLLFVTAAFLLGVNWGLPSRKVDPFLFGDRTPWTGAQIMQLIGDRDDAASIGADVDRNPLTLSTQPVLLNDTDPKRAEIVRRYRLYSYQPDEMITFMALAGMKPGHLRLDPKLYQYGGLWIYPVGAILGAGSVVGLIDLKTDLSYYLDHPEAFARFYIAARLYSAMFGIVGAWVVWWIVKRLTESAAACAFAVIAYSMLPAVINMAHEAKPHLPGAVLMLLAVIAATKFIETGSKKWWIAAGALCGASVGMILSSVPIFIILPIMVLLRPMNWRDRVITLIAAGVIGVDVYAATNPYVVKHLVAWNAAENPLRSNLANSGAMYSAGLSLQSVADASRLLGYAATWPVIALGLLGGVVLCLRPKPQTTLLDSPREPSPRPFSGVPGEGVSILLIAPTLVILLQFAVLAAGKPGEYARFALFPSIVLLIFAVAGIARIVRHRFTATMLLTTLAVATIIHGISYDWHFLLDAKERSTRMIVAERIESARRLGARSVGLHAEPAPYAAAPMNLWDWEIWYSPKRPSRGSVACDVWIEAVDEYPIAAWSGSALPADAPILLQWIHPKLLSTPISWAAKPFSVSGRHALFDKSPEIDGPS